MRRAAGGRAACSRLPLPVPPSLRPQPDQRAESQRHGHCCPAPRRRFQAVLSAQPGGQGSFKLVETNDFKQLPHITLLFRPGNDAAVRGGWAGLAGWRRAPAGEQGPFCP